MMTGFTIIPPGTESEEVYRNSGTWGSTLISHLLRSPKLANLIRTGAFVPERTAPMRFGQIVHQRCDPSFPFGTTYRCGPDADKRTKLWKDAEAAAVAENITLLTVEEWTQVHGMHDSLLANPIAAHLIERAEYEVGFRMASPYGNYSVQCRTDALTRWNRIVDFKTAASLDDFPRSVHQHGYHRQAALYRWLVHAACGEWLPFTFVALEKEAPLFRCRVYDLTADYLDLGWQEVETALIEIGRRTEAGDWEDHRDAEVLEPPRWLSPAPLVDAA